MRNKRAPRRPRRKQARRAKPAAKSSQLITLNAMNQKPIVFKKTSLYNVNGTTIMTGASVPISTVGGANASSMPDWGSITSLFNRYKMKKITYTFTLTTSSANNGLEGDRLPKMFVRYNYDSNLTGAGVLGRFQECGDAKVFNFTPDKTTFSYSYYPRCIEPVYLSGVSTGYKLAKQQYIDVQYGNVPHYGIMWYVDFLAAGLLITYDISYETSFKYEN